MQKSQATAKKLFNVTFVLWLATQYVQQFGGSMALSGFFVDRFPTIYCANALASFIFLAYVLFFGLIVYPKKSTLFLKLFMGSVGIFLVGSLVNFSEVRGLLGFTSLEDVLMDLGVLVYSFGHLVASGAFLLSQRIFPNARFRFHMGVAFVTYIFIFGGFAFIVIS